MNRDIEVHAAVAVELLTQAGKSLNIASGEVGRRMKNAGLPRSNSTAKNWRERFTGRSPDKEGAAAFQATLKEYLPSDGESGLAKLMNFNPYEVAAFRVLRELEYLIRLQGGSL